MNEFQLIEIMAIGNAIEQLAKAQWAAKNEGNDYCVEHLSNAIEQARKALDFAESCDRG